MNPGPVYLLTGFKVIDKEGEGTQMDNPFFFTQMDNPICSFRAILHPFLLYSVAKEGDLYRSPQPNSLPSDY